MFYLSIDVAERQHTAMGLDEQGRVIRPAFSFTNDRSPFAQLLAHDRPYVADQLLRCQSDFLQQALARLRP